MKRTNIITALLTACLMGASAQEATPIDNIVNQLSEVMPNGIQTSVGNHGYGTTISTNAFIFTSDFCAKEVCEGEDIVNSLDDAEAVNEKNRKIYNHILSIIRHGLDSISALHSVEESYHFESHKKGIDTIQYTICLHSGENQIKSRNSQLGYVYFDTPSTEIISFHYISKPMTCGKHFQGHGELKYSRTEAIHGKESAPFNWEQYLQAVTPALDRRGITQRKFRWVRDGSIANEDEFFVFRTDLWKKDDSPLSTGETSGTLYFIPRDREDLMESVVKDFKAATLDYIHEHPEQYYKYNYNCEINLTDKPAYRSIKRMLDALRLGNEQHDYSGYVLLGSDIRGFYILLCDVTDAMGIPDEWAILKSLVDGKKTYHKGMKP